MKRTVRRALVLAASLLVAAALAPTGCALDGTGGRLVELELFVQPGGRAPLGRVDTVTDPSWTVELEEAHLVVGAVYLFGPSAARATGPSALLFSRAFAHPGDDNLYGADALAEHLDPVVMNALSPDAAMQARLLGEVGELGSASVWVDDPPDASGPTRGRQAFVRGTARRGEREVRFEATLELERTPLRRRVDNVRFAPGARLDEGCRVTVEVLAEQWLRAVDFDLWLADAVPEADGVYRPAQPSVFHTGWLLGFHSPSAFRARVEQERAE